MSTEANNGALNGMSWKTKTLNWVKTTRVQTAMVTALSLWVGFMTVSPLDIQAALLLGTIGVLVHLWGFTLNEVEDYKYDARMGDVKGHPIAQGKVHADLARYFAWGSAIIAVAISVLTPYPIEASLVLLGSFVPGYMYDKFSKTHWWSNFYLSAWAAMMVFAGGMYAGIPNIYTVAIALAVSIQIFIQVVQGDLKDIKGPERTLAEKMGVTINHIEGKVYNPDTKSESIIKQESTICEVVSYSKGFSWMVYGLKSIETLALVFVSVDAIKQNPLFPIAGYSFSAGYYTLLVGVGIAFITTVSLFLVYTYDREQVKKMSSVHELTSIVFLGVALAPVDLYGAFLVALAPIVWYATVNYLIHSSALNPDI